MSIRMFRKLDFEDSHGASPPLVFMGIIWFVEHCLICAPFLTANKTTKSHWYPFSQSCAIPRMFQVKQTSFTCIRQSKDDEFVTPVGESSVLEQFQFVYYCLTIFRGGFDSRCGGDLSSCQYDDKYMSSEFSMLDSPPPAC